MEQDIPPAELLGRSVGQMLDWKLMAFCATCRMIASRDVARLKAPPEMRVLDLVAKLRCAKCGNRPHQVTFESNERQGLGSYPLHKVRVLDVPRTNNS